MLLQGQWQICGNPATTKQKTTNDKTTKLSSK
jgi:hypothetical protein